MLNFAGLCEEVVIVGRLRCRKLSLPGRIYVAPTGCFASGKVDCIGINSEVRLRQTANGKDGTFLSSAV